MMKLTVARIVNPFSNLSTISSFNSSIREAVKDQSHPHKALLLFRQLKQSGFQPNNLTFPFIAKVCAKISDLKTSQMIHAHIVKSPHCLDVYVQTGLVDMYVKCDRLDDALDLFDGMSNRDVAAWNAMIMGFVEVGFFDRVVDLFDKMRFGGVWPDSVTVMGLARLVSGVGDVRLLGGVHCLGIKVGLENDVLVANTWIAAYGKCGDLGKAEMVFDGIDSTSLTAVSWNSIIAGCSYAGEGFKAVGLYKRMLYGGFMPDLSTVLNLLGSFVKPESLYAGKFIHCHGVRLGCDMDVAVLNTLISMYSRCSDLNSARSIFDSMTQRTCVSWTAMIGGYAEKGDLEETMALFHAMEAAGQKPDLVTVIYVISVCGQVGELNIGRWIDNYARSRGLKGNIMVCNALLDMFSKFGSMRDAQELFSSMQDRTVVSWTTMIMGYALNGESREALNYFNMMLDLDLKPNHITFLAVLQACVHAGLLEKGREYFDMMTKVYKINASLDHYACIADLLGRRGRLKEALEFIQNMPVKPDAGILGALLSACKNHHNVDIGEYAAHRLFELEPQAAAPYVEMANIYASAGRWDGVTSTRTKMKCNQVRKYPGESIIQMDGKSYKFRVEDRFHPEGPLIFEVLSVVAFHFKEELESSSSSLVFV